MAEMRDKVGKPLLSHCSWSVVLWLVASIRMEKMQRGHKRPMDHILCHKKK